MRFFLPAFLFLMVLGCKTVHEPDVEANEPLGSDLSQLDEETREYWKNAQKGDAEAQNRLAIHYLRGLGGLPSDLDEAYFWFNQSADRGNRWAMSNLAKMYRDGNGVEADVSKAKGWFMKSADAGNYQAMANLGEIYALGRGHEIDLEQASFWYSRAVLGRFDPFIANNAAWFFSTVEDESLLKPALAVNLMLRVVEMREVYYELDTLAAAYAAKGDFDNAIIAQQRALELGYENEVDLEEMDDFEKRLGVYFNQERYIFFKH